MKKELVQLPARETLKVLASCVDVELRESCRNPFGGRSGGLDDHDVSVACKDVNVGRELTVANLHTLELGLRFATR